MTVPRASAGAVQATLLAVGAVVSQAAVLTAVLYYFGWARAAALTAHFGLDLGMLGYTTADYLLHSLNSALPPLVVAAIAIASAVALHRTVVLPRASRIGAWVPVGMIAAGLALAGLVVVGVVFPRQVGIPLGILLPSALVAAAVLIGYAAHLRALSGSSTAGPEVVVMLGLAVLGALWAVALYAQQDGRQRAEVVVANLPHGAEIVLYSEERMAIAGAGVVVTELGIADSAYNFRYAGLRLLVSTPEVHVLLPRDWRKGEGSAFLVPTLDSIRLDVVAPPP